eukprot:2510893-Rhodomonas_salina.1
MGGPPCLCARSACREAAATSDSPRARRAMGSWNANTRCTRLVETESEMQVCTHASSRLLPSVSHWH